MKNIKHLLACSAMLATTFAANPLLAATQMDDDIRFTTAGCGCQNRKRPQPVPAPEVADAVNFTPAGCPCQNKRPPVPRTTPDNENNIRFETACGNCRDKRDTPRRARAGNDDVAFVTVGCGCQNNQKQNQGREQERVQKKPLPPKVENKIYGEMAKRAAQNKKIAGGKNAPESPLGLAIKEKGCNFFGSQGASTYPTLSHFVRETDAQGSIVTIQDGSVWSVKECDQETVKNWSVHTELTIMPNSLSFWNKLTGSRPSHKFRLVNLQNNQTVAANMSLGPFKYNPNTRKIDRIDYARGEIYLNNNSVWKVDTSSPSMQILRDWQKGHAIICGTNDTWFSLGSPFILISVEKENWLPATRVF